MKKRKKQDNTSKQIIYSVIILIIILLGIFIINYEKPQLSPYDFDEFPTEGIIAYYDFEGDANDISGNDNDGALNGATLTTGVFDSQSYLFSGDDYIEVDGTNFNTNAITVSAWVKLSDINGWQGIVTKRSCCNDATDLQFSLQTNPNIQKYGFGVNVNGNVYWAYGITPLSTNWVHLVGTYDGETVKLYVNSTIEKENALPSGNIKTISGAPVIIGARMGNGFTGYADFLKGNVDEVVIYNHTLTADEINILYTGPPQLEDGCFDSDAGQREALTYYEKGTVVVVEDGEIVEDETDYCDDEEVVEFFCDDDELDDTSHECPNDCSNGKCKGEPEEECYDSDGKEYKIFGYVNYTFDGETETFKDTCIKNNPKKINETYCDDDDEYVLWAVATCPSVTSCKDGKCTSGSPEPSPTPTPECVSGAESCEGVTALLCINGIWEEVGELERCAESVPTPEPECYEDIDCIGEGEICDNGGCIVAESEINWGYVFIIGLVALILVVIIFIIYTVIKKKNKQMNPKSSGPAPGSILRTQPRAPPPIHPR